MFIKNIIKVSVGVSLVALLVGCGGGPGDGIGSIDLADYMPAESMSKTYDNYEKWSDEDERNSTSVEDVTVTEIDGNRVITIMSGAHEISKNVISDNNITSKRGRIDIATDRYVDLGDMYYDYTTTIHIDDTDANLSYQCTLEEHLNNFSIHEHSYSGDIYKSKCTMSLHDLHIDGTTYNSYYITYVYAKKDIGLIAEIGKHCYPYDGLEITDDRDLDSCPADKKAYSYKLLRE